MAEWAARKNKRTCKQCIKLADPKSFAKGSRVRIAKVFDCKNCEVTKARPLSANTNVLELYNALPRRFDSSGIKVITAIDVKFVLELFEVPKGLWHDYYQRIIFFHNCLVEACVKQQKAELGKRNSTASWRKKKLPPRRRHMRQR